MDMDGRFSKAQRTLGMAGIPGYEHKAKGVKTPKAERSTRYSWRFTDGSGNAVGNEGYGRPNARKRRALRAKGYDVRSHAPDRRAVAPA